MRQERNYLCINNKEKTPPAIMFRKRCSGYPACFHLKPVFLYRNFRNGYCIACPVQGMTDDPEGALLDPETTEQDKTTTTQPQKMGLAFYGALALVGVLVFLIVFFNVPGIRASAGMLLTQNTWTLQSYVDASGVLSPAITGTPITARFGTDGKVRGSSGCNQYSANYTTRDLAISISPPVMTDMFL